MNEVKPAGIMTVAEWRRLEALKAAVALAASVMLMDVIDVATKFEAYLKEGK